MSERRGAGASANGTEGRAGTGDARPMAFVMEQTLGNTTHYLNLRRAHEATGRDQVRWLPIDYVPGRLPWTVRGSLLARNAVRPLLDAVKGVFVHTMTLTPACFDLFRIKPFVVSTDGGAMAKLDMRAHYGDAPEPKIASFAKRELYRQGFARGAGFVGWSAWAADSLVRHYGCPPRDVAVIPPGVDLSAFAPGARDHALPRILFVGGDFHRKGGAVLLQAFRERLRGLAELVIVTRDAIAEEPGVVVRNNIAANSPELRDLYATSDVFALPTLADCFSLAGMEALASGLPIVLTRTGGLADLVVEGQTGHLVDVGDAATLGARLYELVSDRARCASMGESARADAEARFGAERTTRQLLEFVASRC